MHQRAAVCMGQDDTEKEATRRAIAHEQPPLSPNHRNQRIQRLVERVTSATRGTTDPWSSREHMFRALHGPEGMHDIDPSTYAALLMNFKRRRAWRASVATLSHALETEPHKLNAHHFAMGISACGAARRHRDA
eukprot:CAMPEP_0119094988 /NCGR_PEP_ID=MMETSP1178-20130426/168150_1 /TAXON_ID=33656 /ORGANISM="unid sp, Strain CCMP2000" /LENGTH=133 /DNA_ID=CAMNT_0007078767 /DNA_START=91 /DNA_END=489 /DNA_ORIENTATION=-